VLVNNAGILIPATSSRSLEDWQRLMRVNADSVFLGCTQAGWR
jgi:3(or 17)beta-hydroxysteroid dehydrogenase